MQTTTLQTVELDYNHGHYDYPFLEEDIREKARELLLASPYKKHFEKMDIDTLVESIQYSLSYSQGDGVSFREGSYNASFVYGKTEKEYDVTITTNSFARHNYSATTFEVDATMYYSYNATDREQKILDTLASDLTDELRSICYELEKYGYKHIESYDKDTIALVAFREFCKANNIKTQNEIYHTEYTYNKEPLDGYTLIATPGNTCLDALYAKLPAITPATRTVSYFTFA